MMAEGFQLGDLLGDETKCGLDVAAHNVGIAAEASHALDLQRVVELPFLLKGGALRFGERVEYHLAHGFRVQRAFVDRDDRAVDACAGWRPSAEVKVRSAACHGGLEVFGDVPAHVRGYDQEMPRIARSKSCGRGQAERAVSGLMNPCCTAATR